MRLLFVGKFPPIEGGVSMRSYAFAHEMARRGHRVDVITNAVEVGPNFRMAMRETDWARRGANYGDGAVRVFDTEPPGRSQAHIPMHNPFVTKLASLGIAQGQREPPDAVFSFYLEPYAIAGHLIAGAFGVPHVVKTAGSDVGRLRYHDQFGPLYDHVLRSARGCFVGRSTAEELASAGVAREKLLTETGYIVPPSWADDAEPPLDISATMRELSADSDVGHLVWGNYRPDWPHFGMYGKLGRNKGTFDALCALARLTAAGKEAGLVYVGGGLPADHAEFEATVRDLGIEDRVLRLPFLPHWRIPSFARSCCAILCLEQDFPIAIHRPVIAREVLVCGVPLIASTEILAKMPIPERLISGHNCLAVRDAKSVDQVAAAMSAVLADPAAATAMAARGRSYARDVQSRVSDATILESMIERVLAGEDVATVLSDAPRPDAAAPDGEMPFFRLGGAGTFAPADLAALVPRWIGTLEIDDGADDGQASSPISMCTVRQLAPWRGGPRLLSVDAFTARVLACCDGTETVGEIGRAVARRAGGDEHATGARTARAVRDLIEHALVECRRD